MTSERLERFSCDGTPNFSIQLHRNNVIWDSKMIKVIIEEQGEKHEWEPFVYNDRIKLSSQDKIFFLDP